MRLSSVPRLAEVPAGRASAVALLLLFVASSLGFPGGVAEGADGTGDTRDTADWTYMVYMSADNNLEDEAILNVNQMEAVALPPGLNVVVQLDRSDEYDETNGNWTGTRRYLVEGDSDPDVIGSRLLEDMGEVDMGKGEELEKFVVWALESYPARRYYLDVWGHGGGWRDGTCNDYGDGSVIDMDELGEALEGAREATGVTLDGLGFDQCLMAQLEVYYQIKRSGDVIVGAETLIPSEGYNYTRVLSPLAADTSMDADALAEVIVDAFFDEYGTSNERAHSAVDAERMDAELVQRVNALAQLLRGRADSLHEEIKRARDFAQTYRTTDYIDLGNFTERLLQYLPPEEVELREAAVAVRDEVNRTVIAEGHGTGRNGSTGMSIYFPEYGTAWSYSKLEISQEQRWDEFLEAYFDLRDRPNEAPSVWVTSPHPGSVVGLEVHVSGGANDADGNVTHVEWKLDRGPWVRFEAGSEWTGVVSTAGLSEGMHRLSIRSRDDDGDYSREVQLSINVQDRGLRLGLGPDHDRTFPGGTVAALLNVSAYGDRGARVRLVVHEAPSGWEVELPFDTWDLPANGSREGALEVAVAEGAPLGNASVVLRAYADSAPLVQTFATLQVNVTHPWPDLVVGPVRAVPAEPREGDVVAISANVTNSGLVDAGPFDVELSYTVNGSENGTVVLRELHVEGLPVGGTVVIHHEWTASLGMHLFTVVADVAGNLSDLSPEDDEASLEVMLEGYGVRFRDHRVEVGAEPGDLVQLVVSVRNTGNLPDILRLLPGNRSLSWPFELNETSFIVPAGEVAQALLEVTVPVTAVGGDVLRLQLNLTSFHEEAKRDLMTVVVSIPEVWGLNATLDTVSGSVGRLGTASFNLTVRNLGNGYDNYTIEYVRQTEELLTTPVNDTLELAPGCSTAVEVFVSDLGEPSGGRSFLLRFTVRSADDPTLFEAAEFNLTVERDFAVGFVPEDELIDLAPGRTVFYLDVTLSNDGNYDVPFDVVLTEPASLFGEELLPSPMESGTLTAGASFLWTFTLVVLDVPGPGDYGVVLELTDQLTWRSVTANVTVRVPEGRGLSMTFNEVDPSRTLTPDVLDWGAVVELVNSGNVDMNVRLEVVGTPGWLVVTVEPSLLELSPGEMGHLTINVTVGEREEPFEGDVLLSVEAWPEGHGDEREHLVLTVPVSVEEAWTAGSTWLLYLTVVMVLVVAVVVALVFRRLR